MGRARVAGRGEQDRETVFGLDGAARGGDFLNVLVAVGADEEEADGHAYARRYKAEAGALGGEAVGVFVDEGEGCEEDVEDAVHDRDVDAHHCDDRREEEHLHGADYAPEE